MTLATIEPFVASGRILPSWIDGFVQLSERIESPELFRKWAAISAVGAALERKVWLRSQGEDLYPNLYILLVGPPGSGKTRAVNACQNIYRDLGTHNLAKVSLSKAALMDELAAASRINYKLQPDTYNSMYIVSKEFSALMPAYDSDIMAALVVVYEGDKYDEKRRGAKDPVIIERPQLNMIGCTQPSYLMNTMPVAAWEQGFLSRVIIIYQDIVETPPKLNLMGEQRSYDKELAEALVFDMKAISERIGRMRFTQAAADAAEAWNENRKEEVTHPRLQHYATRRIMNMLKLCMIAAVDRGAEAIDLPDFQRAYNWLTEAEHFMPQLFTAMQSGGDAVVINDAWHYALTYHAQKHGGLPLHMFTEFLSQRLPAMSVQKVIDLMTSAKMISSKVENGVVVVYGRTNKKG